MSTPVTTTTFVRPSGLAGLVKTAVTSDTAGLLAAIAGLVGNARDVYQLPDGSWPIITRRTWLSYRWIARYDANKRPASGNGAVAGDQFVAYADSFLGAPPYATPDGA